MRGSYWLLLTNILLLLVLVTVLFAQPGQSVPRKLARSSLNARVDRLTDMTRRHSVIRMDSKQYREYIAVSPRNYTAVVMFTAIGSEHGCHLCGRVQDEFHVVADSHRRAVHHHPDKLLFFAMVDIADGQDVFRMLKLTTAPQVIHYPPKGRPGRRDNLDIERAGLYAEKIAKWITVCTDIPIRVVYPRNYIAYLNYIMMAIITLSCIYKRRNNMEVFCNTTYWGLTLIGFCCLMASGQMWNLIRGSPYYMQNQHGVTLIHRSQQGQFVGESFIVMALYGLISLGMILIIEAGVRKGDVDRRNKMAGIGAGLLVGFFSILLVIVRMKLSSYPYYLFLM